MLVSLLAYPLTLKMEADMFLRNVDWLSTDYNVFYLRRQNSSRPQM
jgi:hypothetical protein